ncbi:hypothetical protein A0H81_12611 [Grifola frondosa]|uniref:Uncharacterized protein n=1 Tax=Grifola frondosa TaxID=5627 RepID=A0A1C7LWX9_GRIFR|nr:hypothetical protein A0H81_12611 [Grifola frondosa]
MRKVSDSSRVKGVKRAHTTAYRDRLIRTPGGGREDTTALKRCISSDICITRRCAAPSSFINRAFLVFYSDL